MTKWQRFQIWFHLVIIKGCLYTNWGGADNVLIYYGDRTRKFYRLDRYGPHVNARTEIDTFDELIRGHIQSTVLKWMFT